MRNLIDPLLEIEGYNTIIENIKKGHTPVSVSGPSESQKVHLAYSICTHTGRKGVFIACNELSAKRFYEDISFFLNEGALNFPSKEILLYDVEARSQESLFKRISVLDKLICGDFDFLVTSPEAIVNGFTGAELFKKFTFTLNVGDFADFDDIIKQLVKAGYERTDTVEGRGQLASRGGIIDVFSPDALHPYRIEFFGDEIDSLREFDEISQRSMDNLGKIRILPSHEIVYDDREAANAQKRMIEAVGKAPEVNRSKVLADIDKISGFSKFPGLDKYLPYIVDRSHSFFEYTDCPALFFMDEPDRIKQRVENMITEHFENCRGLIEKGSILPSAADIMLDFEQITQCLNGKSIVNLSTFYKNEKGEKSSQYISISSRLISPYHGKTELLAEDIRHWKQKGARTVILSGTRGKGERLADELAANGIESFYSERHQKSLQKGQVVIIGGKLSKGFEYTEAGLVFISESDISGQPKRAVRVKTKMKGRKINLFSDLKSGDYIVHQSHGIGVYTGIEQLAVEGVKRDYLKIRYQAGDVLYIPTNQMDVIQKYIGSEDKTPRVNKLGSNDWTKTKNKVRESLKYLAEELVKLYAKRQSVKGHAFSKDTVWQQQFEEQFPYNETEDQLRCTAEIKEDMESERIMDRLLCGDVGYGKTEVAVRAMFKAVMDGKQVAYLVPTTVLAQQHYTTFCERFKDYPVTVDMMSRFRSAREQKETIKNIKAGNVDIVIGTHRLLQKDIEYKALGLLVVDEEQRFGVSHKEKIKKLSPNIDVLTLTATPIPRTLHMSLSGIRDISVIEDPPEERYPVQTYVMEYNDEVIRDAIYRELARDGQVFYLYNRVRSIDLRSEHVSRLAPDARIAIAHGQMDERQLEDIMMAFVKREYDILVCTTIIESGLDIPNVNTIVVEDSDKMGLSQLYQLRGRVGRSNRLAYAYITYRKDKIISEVAEKRLQAIREFTEFGSGFKIAMRDMEIRGAGNLLGSQQHGHMQTVGYDMYCRLLDEAVRELKGEPVPEAETEVSIDINISAYIDSSYIENESQKLDMYRKIASIQNEEDAGDVTEELIDRYGDLPEPVKALIAIALLKAMARDVNISSITEKNDNIFFEFASSDSINISSIGKLVGIYGRKLLFNAGSTPYLAYRIAGEERKTLTDNIKIVLQHIKSYIG